MLKEVKNANKGTFPNPLIINKIGVDQLGAHEYSYHNTSGNRMSGQPALNYS